MSELNSLLIYSEHKLKKNTIVFDPTLASFEDNLILAPMQGLTSLYFRKAFQFCFPLCADYAISPFISLTAGELDASSRKFRDVRLGDNKDSLRVVPQLIGSDANGIVKYADLLFDMGYPCVNLNLACPAKLALKHNRGSALLKDLNALERLLKSICSAMKGSLSVKIRIGYDSKRDLSNLIGLLNDLPLHSVIAHPRLAVQMYEGCCDYEAFDLLASSLRHRLVYNGDTKTPKEFSEIKNRFPQIKDYMIGRGVLRDPLLFAKIRGLNFADNVLELFFLKLEEFYLKDFLEVEDLDALPQYKKEKTEKALSDKMKELSSYLFPDLFPQIASCKNVNEINTIVSRRFQ